MKRLLLLFVLCLPAPAAGCGMGERLVAQAFITGIPIPSQVDGGQDLALREFDEINQVAFGGRLSRPTLIRFWRDRDKDVMGRSLALGSVSVILLRTDVLDRPDVLRAALAHEMVHLDVGDGAHGPAFEVRARRVAELLGIDPARLLVNPYPPPAVDPPKM